MKNHSIPAAPQTDDTALRRVSIVLVLAIFGGFGTWAALAPLNSAVHIPGLIIVENYRKAIQHLEGGIVETINVRDGDWVEKGQILLTLDDIQPRSQLEVLRGQYLISLAREARLVALRDSLPQIIFPKELLDAKADTRTEEAMRVQAQIFKARRQSHENEIKLYKEQINQLYVKESGLKAQKVSHDKLLRSYESELQDYQLLFKEGYSDKQTVRNLERKFAESEGQSGELQSSMAAIALQISETRIKMLQIQKQLQNEVIKELADVQSSLFELHEKIHALEQTVERSVIKAPVPGKILGLTVHTLGGVIAPGSRILEIVPQNEKLLIEARVPPMDIDRVKIGQKAEIRFSVFKSNKLPRIEGKLLDLSADSLVGEDPQQTPYYLARLEVDNEGMAALDNLNLELLPGMPVEVFINTGKRTFIQYMAGPLGDLMAHSMTED